MDQKEYKRPWRKLIKKLQRKRRRQNVARQRDKELEQVAELEKLKDPMYKLWLEQKETIKRQQELSEENKRFEQEQLWIRREQVSQKQFERDRLKAEAEEAKLEAEKLKQGEKLKLLEEVRQKKREEIKLQAEKASKDFDNIMMCMHEYLEDHTMKTPSRLECIVQSRPGEKSCDFFDKTNCCRYEPGCAFNHKRPMLSKIILIKHFFQHPLLEQQEHEEYSRSDSELELDERDLRDSYDEFCEDVWPVLEKYGRIRNFCTIRNVQVHLRGHVFVEYAEKRSALKAFINLQNRYYASKRLNVEFSNIRQWRTGVCGLSLVRKCPRGIRCNFLHLMKNIDNKYNTSINDQERFSRSASKYDKAVPESSATSWNFDETVQNKSLQSQNWRWSESPELELKTKSAEEKSRSKTSSEKKNSSNSSQRKSSRRRQRSNSSDSNLSKISRKSRSKTPCSRHHKSKKKYSAADKKEDLNKDSKAEAITRERRKSDIFNSRQRKSTHRRSNSSNFNHYKSAKKSRS